MRDWMKRILPGVIAAALLAGIYSLPAVGQPHIRQLNSIRSAGDDCDTVTGGCYYQLLAGQDSNGVVRALATDASGQLTGLSLGTGTFSAAAALADDTTNPTTTLVGSMLFGFDGTTWDRLETVNGGHGFWVAVTDGGQDMDIFPSSTSDDVATSNPLFPTASHLYGFDGTTWDRLDSNDTGALVTEVCDSGSGSTLCADVQTAGADNVVNTENQLTTAAFLYGFDGTTWDRLQTVGSWADNMGIVSGTLQVLSFPMFYDRDAGSSDIGSGQPNNADDRAVVTQGGALLTASNIQGFDEDDTNFDRIYSYDTDGDNVAEEAEGVTLAVTNFPTVYDLTGDNFDRMSTGMVTGAGLPGAAVTLGVDNTSSCMSALSVGYYRVQAVASSVSVAYCCRSGTSCTATTSDAPYTDGNFYYESVTDAAANDVICCIAASGTNSINLFAVPLTF